MIVTSQVADNEAVAHRWHMDIFSAGKPEVADEILAPGFVFQHAGPRTFGDPRKPSNSPPPCAPPSPSCRPHMRTQSPRRTRWLHDRLRHTSTAVAQIRVEYARGAGESSDLASSLLSLSTALYGLGRYGEALAATEEAVALYRRLTRDDPVLHCAGLVRALDDLGVALNRVGRHDKALAPAKAAVALYFGQARHNPVYRPHLAAALDNLGAALGEVGRYDLAIAAIEKAVGLYRGLARDDATHCPDLAGALLNLGVGLERMGSDPDALSPARKAVALFRRQARDDPVRRPDLAWALRSLGVALGRVGRYDAAVPAIEEAVVLYRELDRDNPAIHRPDLALALALDNLAAALGRPGGPLRRCTRHRQGDRQTPPRPGPARSRPLPRPASPKPSTTWEWRCTGRAATRTRGPRPRRLSHSTAAWPAMLPSTAPTARALRNLGAEWQEAGHRERAVHCFREAGQLFREAATTLPEVYGNEYAATQRHLRNLLRAMGGTPTRSSWTSQSPLLSSLPLLPGHTRVLGCLGKRFPAGQSRKGNPQRDTPERRHLRLADQPFRMHELAGSPKRSAGSTGTSS
jgi:tetratricopeptide (TPR) repeat protein